MSAISQLQTQKCKCTPSECDSALLSPIIEVTKLTIGSTAMKTGSN